VTAVAAAAIAPRFAPPLFIALCQVIEPKCNVSCQ
jgi:hypothetical protein